MVGAGAPRLVVLARRTLRMAFGVEVVDRCAFLMLVAVAFVLRRAWPVAFGPAVELRRWVPVA